jgi:hypothetical protein
MGASEGFEHFDAQVLRLAATAKQTLLAAA